MTEGSKGGRGEKEDRGRVERRRSGAGQSRHRGGVSDEALYTDTLYSPVVEASVLR